MKACLAMVWAACTPFCLAQSPPATSQIQYSPMTGKERLRQYLRDTISPVSVASAAVSAGFGQWRDRPPEWSEGAQGYARRFGSAYSEHLVQATLAYGISAALQEDNRYIPSGLSGVRERTQYAVTSSFLARGRDGTRHVSISTIGTLAGAALISRLWQPRSSGGLGSAAVNFGSSLGVAAGFDIVREFWHRKR